MEPRTMLGLALTRKRKPHDKPRITPWPMIAVFAGAVVLLLCVGMIPANPSGTLAQRLFLPEIAAVLCFYVVGRSRSAVALALCLFLLPTALAMLVYGPAGCLDWTHESLELITKVYGL